MNSLPFGVCTWIFGDEPLDSVAQRAARLGLDGLALKGELPLDADAIRRTLAKHNLRPLAFTPADVDLAHPAREIREQAKTYFRALIEFAASLETPLVGCHNLVGRVRAEKSFGEEWNWFAEGVDELARYAQGVGVTLALECLNRYESHLCNTAAQGLALIRQVNSPALGLLLDTYHMNIEEANLADAIRCAGKHLVLFHVADSNRQAVGNGHIDFEPVIRALAEIDYRGSIIIEVTAPGADPFTPMKSKGDNTQVWQFVEQSVERVRAKMP